MNDNIDQHWQKVYFNFVRCFSRFEFCLKHSAFHRRVSRNGVAADWDKFTCRFSCSYKATDAAKKLRECGLRRQTYNNGNTAWHPVDTNDCCELGAVVRLLKTLRNNLFHGDKEGDINTGSVQRNTKLLCIGIKLLDELAVMVNYELPEFLGKYQLPIKQ